MSFGPCMSDWCDREGVVYVAETVGRSPRVLIIAGEKADMLASGAGGVYVRCLDCAVEAVERVGTRSASRHP